MKCKFCLPFGTLSITIDFSYHLPCYYHQLLWNLSTESFGGISIPWFKSQNIFKAFLLFLPQHTKPNNESQQMPILYKPWVIVVFWSTYFQANNFNIFPIWCIKLFGNCHLSSAHSVKLFYSSSWLAFSYTLGLSCCKFLFKQAL